MKTITYSVVLTLSCYLLAAQEIVTSKTKTTAEAVYEKAVADNTKEAERAYQAYVKALDEANAKVLKALESAKADLNDTKKFTKLTITERATAIAEIEEKIKAVKAGAVGEAITAGETGKPAINIPKYNMDQAKAIVGKWNLNMISMVGVLEVKPNGYATFAGHDLNNNAPNSTRFTWKAEKDKVVFDANGRGREFLYLTVESPSRAAGTWWGGSSAIADKVK